MSRDTHHIDSLTGLIKLAAEGDVHSFKLLVDEFSGYAFNLAYKTLFDKDDAKDIVQESFVRVWKRLKNYKPEIKFTTWLYKIVINLCYDKIKYGNRRKVIFQNIDEKYSNIVLASDSVEKNVNDKLQIEMILRLVEDLPPKQKMVFLMRDIQEHNISETSELLGISESSVKANLFNARKTIAERISNMEKRRR